MFLSWLSTSCICTTTFLSIHPDKGDKEVSSPWGSENRPAGCFGSPPGDGVRPSGSWAEGGPEEWRSHREQLLGGSSAQGQGLPTLNPFFRNPTLSHRSRGCPAFGQALWEGGWEQLPAGNSWPQSPAPRASPPTEGEGSIHPHPNPGNALQAGNNSEARFKRSAGKGFSLEFILLWKGLWGHSARPSLPGSLTTPFPGKRTYLPHVPTGDEDRSFLLGAGCHF